jgi:hypothetical protein
MPRLRETIRAGVDPLPPLVPFAAESAHAWAIRRHAIAAIWLTAGSFAAVAALVAARMLGFL